MITDPKLLSSAACFYNSLHKFPIDMGACQVLCINLFFGPLTFFHFLNHNLGLKYDHPPQPPPCLLPA